MRKYKRFANVCAGWQNTFTYRKHNAYMVGVSWKLIRHQNSLPGEGLLQRYTVVIRESNGVKVYVYIVIYTYIYAYIHTIYTYMPGCSGADVDCVYMEHYALGVRARVFSCDVSFCCAHCFWKFCGL